jgi:hypothetical protein
LHSKSFCLYHCLQILSYSFNFKSFQIKKQHLRLTTGTMCPQWMWPNSWTTGTLSTRPR